jgi:hypothetical protein
MKPGSKVKIVGLESKEGQQLNGLEGVVDHFSRVRDRYGISLPGVSDMKMMKESNLQLIEDADAPPIFGGEEGMIEHLKKMGMPAQMVNDLTPAQKKQMLEMTQRQNILERATKLAGVDAAASNELKDAGVYSWRDASDHVYLEVKCGDAKDVTCKIEMDSIEICDGDTQILKGKFFQTILARESKWEKLGDGKLAITLKKVSPMRWLMALR